MLMSASSHLVFVNHITKVDVLDGLYLSSIEHVHPTLLVLNVAEINSLEQAEEGARRRPNDPVQVLGFDLRPSRPSVFWLSSPNRW